MKLAKQIFSYTMVNVINSSVPFLLLPILTAYLKPSDYGLLSLIQLLMIISLPIVLMNTHGLLTIEYSKLTSEKFQNLISTIIWIPIISFLFLEILFFIFKNIIIEYFHIPINYIYIIPFFVLLQAIPTIIPILFQAKKEPLNFGKYKISMTILNVLLSLYFVVLLDYGWEGRLWGIVGAFSVFSIIGLVILFKLNLLNFTLNKALIKSVLMFGLPLIPHTIIGTFLTMSDRIFIVNMIGSEAVGIYSVAFQISMAIAIIMGSINQAWSPYLFEKLNNNPNIKDKKNLVKQIYIIMALMMIITIIFILISPFIFDIFIDKAYIEGKKLITIIAIAFMFQGFYYMITNFIFYTKKTYLLSYSTSVATFISLLLNYFLINIFGIIGAAYAMLIGWIIFFCIIWIVANKVYKMPWNLK